jgi:hypothetical protein
MREKPRRIARSDESEKEEQRAGCPSLFECGCKLAAQILDVGVSSETHVIGQIAAMVIGIFVEDEPHNQSSQHPTSKGSR